MKGTGRAILPLVYTLVLSLLTEACLFSASQKEWIREPWPQGAFELRAATRTVSVTGNLYIDRAGDMTFSTTAGFCQDRTPVQVEEDRAGNQRTFPCSGATFVIHPKGETLQGQALIPVTETVSEGMGCVARNRKGQCIESEMRTREREIIRSVRLTVIKKG